MLIVSMQLCISKSPALTPLCQYNITSYVFVTSYVYF